MCFSYHLFFYGIELIAIIINPCINSFIPIVLKDAIGKNVCEYCKKGDILGIKGRTESIKEDDSYNIRIVAERVTFLSSKKDAEKFD